MELILAPFLMLLSFQGKAQYLNDTVQTILQNEFTVSYCFDGGNLTSVNRLSDSNWVQNGWNSIQFKQYDDDFNIIRETRFQDSVNVYRQGFDLIFSSGFYYFSGYRKGLYMQGEERAYVMKFDSLGNVIWLNEFYTNVPNSRITHLEKAGNDILIAGYQNYEPDSTVQYSFLAKIDSSGSLLWTKILDESNNSAVIDFKVLDSDDIIINLGFEDGPQNIKTMIYKLTPSGNITWSRVYGINGSWLKSIAATSEIEDGSLLCYGAIADPNGADFERSWLLKLDSNGNLIKDTIYKFSTNRDWFESAYSNPLVTSNEILLLGHYREDGAAQRQSYLASIDFDLNLNWKRIHGNYVKNNELSFLHDLENGFYLMAGHINNENPNSPVVDEWFMVVDSLGCDVADCSLGLDEIEKNKVGFTISPNPSSSFVQIQLRKAFNYNDEMEYQLIDSYGRLLKKAKLRNGDIDVSKLQSGMYYIRVMADSLNLGTKRLIVQ